MALTSREFPQDSSPVWVPIVEPSNRARTESAVESIAHALSESDVVRLYGQSLAGGSAGVALFFSYLSKTNANERLASQVAGWLSHASDGLSAALGHPTFYGGCTGVAWAVEHLGRGLLCGRVAEEFPDVDARLLTLVERGPWKDHYDLVGGLVGYGLYALERRGHPHGAVLLEFVIDRLAELAVPMTEGVTWLTPPELMTDRERARRPDGCFDLGLAHGVPGVIRLLAGACAAHVAVPKARPLLEQAVTWLLAQRNPDGADSCFGYAISKGKPSARPTTSRIAWCYGDLGLSAALYCAALEVGAQTWGAAALDIARRAAGRSLDQAGVEDARICHGSAGNLHLFNRLYQATREPVFLRAARAWLGRTLTYYHPGAGLGGFKARWNTTEPGHAQWRHLPGVLDGAAGIGLALLAATSDVEPEWDRMLAVAIPSAHGGPA